MNISPDLLTARALGLPGIHALGSTTCDFRAAEIRAGWGCRPSLWNCRGCLGADINAQAPLATLIATDMLLIRSRASRIIISFTRWGFFCCCCFPFS